MPVTTEAILSTVSLTGIVNEIKPRSTFLRDLLFSRHETQPTENIEFGILTGARQVAPYVRKGAAAVMVGGYDEKTMVVSPPNIRIKRPTEANELLFRRPAGTPIHVGTDQVSQNFQRRLALDTTRLNDMIAHAEEYQAAMIGLRGAMSWTDELGDVWEITLPRPAGNNITLSVFWNDADITLPAPYEDFNTAKRVVSEEVGLSVTDVIMGSEAAAAFRRWVYKTPQALNKLDVSEGAMSFAAQYTRQGVIYLGVYCGVRVWEYVRSFDILGVSTPLVRAKYAEFITMDAAAEDVLYYGAIPDMDAIEAGVWQTERFSKSWIEKDPSVRQLLIHSRPLCVTRRPGSKLSMKVVSG